MTRICKKHGKTEFVKKTSKNNGVRCKLCRSEAVARRRQKLKEILVSENGNRCSRCGYDKYIGALVFHHVNPKTKKFALSVKGLTRSIDKLRAEAKKCILLCHNCHTEVHHEIYISSLV